jgi:Uma2 family endonuclease
MATVLAPNPVVERSSGSDEPLYEIVHGERVDLPPMSILSNMIAGHLYVTLVNYLRSHPVGTAVIESLLIFDDEATTCRRPDVAFVSAERWPLDRPIPETGDWRVVPDLAVEVASPNDIFSDAVGKLGEYFAHGVREAWQVIPEEQQVYVYTSPTEVRILTREKSLESPLLPGLSIPLAEVFARAASTRIA